jgi:hypothetical protein
MMTGALGRWATGNPNGIALDNDVALPLTGASMGALLAQDRGSPLLDTVRGGLKGLATGGGALLGMRSVAPESALPGAAAGGLAGYLSSLLALKAIGIDRAKNKSRFRKAAASDTLMALLAAKAESDAARYRAKHQIMRNLMKSTPADFTIDSDNGRGIVGVTHTPTGFRMHLPSGIIPADVGRPSPQERLLALQTSTGAL